MPTKTSSTLTIEGSSRPVRRVQFGIHVNSEVWDKEAKVGRYDPEHAQVTYWLEVDVDEHSGEDGAPQPQVQDIPVARAAGGRHPTLAQLGTLTVKELDDGYDCDEWDAWFGNDAPGLCGNVVRFGGWEGNALRVRWEAHYDDRGQQRPFLFEGLAEFTGIYVSVKQPEEADLFLSRAWGGQAPETLDKHSLGWSDYGPRFAENRRRWFSVVYGAKGAPLADRYRRSATTERPAATPSTAPAPVVAPTPAAIPAPVAAEPARRLSAAKTRFSLEVPGDWTALPAAEDPVMASLGGLSLRRGVGPGAETLKAVAVEMLIANDLDDYVDTSIGAYKAIWDVEERGPAKLAGRDGLKLVILQRNEPATTRLLKYFVSAGKKKAVILTFAAPPAAFAERLASYEAIADSLRLGGR